jgi:inosine-uridine nucleoside N-ribohydrolase
MASLHKDHEGDNIGISLHDPLCVWYLFTQSEPQYAIKLAEPKDIRVETSGQWTRGMYVIDRRDRRKMPGKGDEPVEVVGDAGVWLDQRAGNKIRVAVESGGQEIFGEELIKRILSI